MASPDSQLEAIMTQLGIELAKITTTNGYHTDVKEITYFPDEWLSWAQIPSILIDYGSGEEEKTAPNEVHCEDIIRIRISFDKDPNNPICKQMAKFITDLRYLLYVQNPQLTDASGDNLVVTVRIESRTADRGEQLPVRILLVNLEVDYHTKLT